MPKLNDNRRKPSWLGEYWVEVLIVISGLVFINLIFFSNAFRQTQTINLESTAQVGSFVGGYVGSMFALVGVVLLYSTLKGQRRASEKEAFETKYFELIRMHRDNVAGLEIQGTSGRKVFVLLIRELRCALEIVREIAKSSNLELNQRQLLHVAYYCLYFGVGPNSSRMLKKSFSEFNASFIDAIENELSQKETKERARAKRGFDYTPFEGHQSRLGHYYRHLYQMVRYVDQQTLKIDKYDYVKTIRAQLSTHEQALLLVNSLTPLGQNWWQNHLIVPYRLVQNIPRDFFDGSTELDMTTLFKPGYFEWEESAAEEAGAGADLPKSAF